MRCVLTLTGCARRDLIDADGEGAIEATETGRAVLARMYQAGAEVTGQLWSQHGNALAGLNDLAGRVVQAGLATGGDAYLTMAPPYESADATVGVLCITGCRYCATTAPTRTPRRGRLPD